MAVDNLDLKKSILTTPEQHEQFLGITQLVLQKYTSLMNIHNFMSFFIIELVINLIITHSKGLPRYPGASAGIGLDTHFFKGNKFSLYWL